MAAQRALILLKEGELRSVNTFRSSLPNDENPVGMSRVRPLSREGSFFEEPAEAASCERAANRGGTAFFRPLSKRTEGVFAFSVKE